MYAGGAGAALDLLFSRTFSKIHINDADYSIYSFWYSLLNNAEEFIHLIENTSVTIEEWARQKEIYKRGRSVSILELGFSTFFLNRTNRSGIIFKAGPIGGQSQNGNYKIDVRFNKTDLIKRIEKINVHRDDIILTNEDAVNILNNLKKVHEKTENLFIYLDPPYYNKGEMLYLNNYSHFDHQILSKSVSKLDNIKWLISYDNVPQIRELYGEYRMSSFDLNYTLQSKKFGSELLVFSKDLKIPGEIKIKNRTSELALL